jgi:hypothetical protein
MMGEEAQDFLIALLDEKHDAIACPKWRATVDEDGHYCFAVAL